MTIVAWLKSRVRGSPTYQRWADIRQSMRRARIHQDVGALPVGSRNLTFVLICGGEFDQSIPNAATTMRMGWCRGFEQLGIPYKLVPVHDIRRVIPSLPNPFCWISGSDYSYLKDGDLSFLRRFKHAVLVSTAFDEEGAFFSSRGYPNVSWPPALRAKILSTEPKFLFTMSGESRFHYYQWWLSAGCRLVSLPLACDTTLYEWPRSDVDFSGVDVAFVGGYWDYKARQFDRYLRPLASRLRVYGYSPWPYGQYGGVIAPDHEGSLYRQALVSPIINEPHVCEMSVDINERVFKVLGAGGLAVCDPTKGYRDWFSPKELLVPEGESEYWEMVNGALGSPTAFQDFRTAGKEAVLKRHTYKHRARQFITEMGLEIEPSGEYPCGL
jgi:hypothetical protein